MPSVNKVILMGHLGKDPEVKYTPAGTAVANFSVATNDKYKDKSGNWQDKTEWHNIVVWGGLAENCGKFLKKGRVVYIEGKLETRSWDDKQTGEKKYRTEVIAGTVVFIGGDKPAAKPAAPAQASFDAPVADPLQITDQDMPF